MMSRASRISGLALLLVLVIVSSFLRSIWLSSAPSTTTTTLNIVPNTQEVLSSNNDKTTKVLVSGGGERSVEAPGGNVAASQKGTNENSASNHTSTSKRGGEDEDKGGRHQQEATIVNPSADRRTSSPFGPNNHLLSVRPTGHPTAKEARNSTGTNASSPYAARTSGPTTPFNGPLWEPPSLTNPEITSDFNDWKWTFPTPLTNRKDYIAQRYLPHEVQDDCSHVCCVGASSNGGGGVAASPKCFNHMDFMADYQLLHSNRATYSLVDSIKLYRRMHGKDAQLRIMLIGDSVTGQYYTAALCDALRNEAVSRVLLLPRRELVPVNQGVPWNHKLHVTEGIIWLRDDPPERNTSVVYVKNYRIRQDSAPLESIFNEFDILLFGWGLHYELNNIPLYASHLQFVVRAASKASFRAKWFLWFGAPKQHFLYDGDPQTDGAFSFAMRRLNKLQTCGPTMKVPFNSTLFDARNKAVATIMTQANWTVRWVNVSEYELNCEKVQRETAEGPVLHMLQNFGWTAPFFRNHDWYSSNQSAYQHDCTHSCWAPNLYEPLWDALYLVLSSRACDRAAKLREPLFPSNTWTAEFVNKSRQGEVRLEQSKMSMPYSVSHRLYELFERTNNTTVVTKSPG